MNITKSGRLPCTVHVVSFQNLSCLGWEGGEGEPLSLCKNPPVVKCIGNNMVKIGYIQRNIKIIYRAV